MATSYAGKIFFALFGIECLGGSAISASIKRAVTLEKYLMAGKHESVI